jgi:hypothetical protein
MQNSEQERITSKQNPLGIGLNHNQEVAKGTIPNNQDKVCCNCLTFMTSGILGDIRSKCHNKFNQSWEPQVREIVLEPYRKLDQQPRKILRSSINKCLDSGILRLRITYYKAYPSKVFTVNYITKALERLKQLIHPSLLFDNPITSQFNILCSAIQHNLALLDLDSSTALIWCIITRYLAIVMDLSSKIAIATNFQMLLSCSLLTCQSWLGWLN